MMTGIGTSHLVTAPAAGGRFEFALLWCIPVAYVFKYYGFEMAFRFTHATGRSMLDAYATAPRKWPLWYVLVTTLLQCAIGQAGRLAAAAAVVYYFGIEFFGLDVPIQIYGIVLGVVAVSIILVGKYAALELATKLLAAMLLISTVAVYVVEPAPISALGHFFIIEVPEQSWLVIAAFLGLLPTGIDVSLQASEWGEGEEGWDGPDPGAPRGARAGAGLQSVDVVGRGPQRRHDKAAGACPRVLPALVPDRAAGLRVGARGVVSHCHYLPAAVRRLAVSRARWRETP